MCSMTKTNKAPREYISLREAAEILSVSDRTIRNMLADGRLRGYRIGKLIRLARTDVLDALQPIRAA